MPTMKDVAREADVSVATVSRVLNESANVSQPLVQRVHAVMEKLQYRPSSIARNLQRRETRTIGVLIPQLDHPLFSRLAFSLESALFDADYRTLICSVEENANKERAYVEMLLRQQIDGMVVLPSKYSKQALQPFVDEGIPLVLVDRDLPVFAASRVLSDNANGGYLGMKHLLELGHRCIGVVYPSESGELMSLRKEGIFRAAAEFGLYADDLYLYSDTLPAFDTGQMAFWHLYKRNPAPTAIFALTDTTAIGVLHAAFKTGLQLPEELSLISFDDVPLGSYSIPALTTIAQPTYKMGFVAAELLLECIQNEKQAPTTILLPTMLIVRESTCAYVK